MTGATLDFSIAKYQWILSITLQLFIYLWAPLSIRTSRITFRSGANKGVLVIEF
jgi:cytidylate kinase